MKYTDLYKDYSLNFLDINRLYLGAGFLLMEIVEDFPVTHVSDGIELFTDSIELNKDIHFNNIPVRAILLKWSDTLISEEQQIIYNFLKISNQLKKGSCLLFTMNKTQISKTVPQIVQVYDINVDKQNVIDIEKTMPRTFVFLGYENILGYEKVHIQE